jgi:prevent-host-death family protein
MVVAMVAGPWVGEAADDGPEGCPALLEGALLVDGPARLCEAVEGGQVIVLTRHGSAAAVVLDLDTYAEWAEAVRVPTGSP